MIAINESIIGKEACVLRLSVISADIVCKKDTIKAYMVERVEAKVRTKIRFKDGRWEEAERVFYPEDEAAERKKFAEKYGGK